MTMRGSITIGDTMIDGDSRPYVIAEISANHGGGLDRALELVSAAADSGADAVKFQHFTPDTITVRSSHPDFIVKGGTLWDSRELFDLYAEAMTPWEWTEELVAACEGQGVDWFSSPFDPTAVDFLDALDVPAFKIASFEIVDLPLIRHAASKGRPLVISTGMASVGEIDAAVMAALDNGAASVALLRCNSGYPAAPEEMDLRAIPVMRDRWGVQIGLSDHSIGATAAITSVALGASIIEKHLTLRRTDGGPDAAFSSEPAEFAAMVEALRESFDSLGVVRFGPSSREQASLLFRRSLRVVRPIEPGERITGDNVRSIRPAGGLAPDRLDSVTGWRVTRRYEIGDPLTEDDLRDPSE
jgi:pseudaminic acid synthase